jgi:hypothetical protein
MQNNLPEKQPLSALLSEYRPRPGKRFYQKMENAPWNIKDSLMQSRSAQPIRPGWQLVLVTMIVLALLSFSIPAVRAALSAWLGLSVAPSNQMPASAVTLVAPPSPSPAPTLTAPATITPAPTQAGPTPTSALTQPAPAAAEPVAKPEPVSALAPQAGWEILYPARLPEGYQYQSAYFDANHKMVILTFLVTRPLPGDASLTASRTITLLQALKNDFVPMQVAPGTSIEDIQVNGQPAAYSIGAWDSEFVKDDKDPNGGKMVSTWRSDLAIQNIYWQVGPVYLALFSDDDSLSKQDLIDMAGSISK